jgi:hypothetical protein
LTVELREHAYQTDDIVFFGRLVFEKGCDDLIRAYGLWIRGSAGDEGARGATSPDHLRPGPGENGSRARSTLSN